MSLQIYNTMTRKKEEFVPLKRNFVQIYTCGLTVYDFMHIGHARTYLFWDVVRRYFTHQGYDVFAIINNTDIDDKNIARAGELGVSYKLTGEFFTRAFYDDMRALGIRPYALDCTASDYIPEMIDTVQRIVANGFGYVVDGDVFFAVEKFSGYGKLSGHKLEDLAAGSRVEVDERKRHPADFALWKAAKPGEPSWESPWGAGRPGWHVECSSMAYHFFGGAYDIKGGAVDNMFPHHENEIAQTFAAYGIPLATYYMHPEHFLVEGTKMSKSLGNFVTTRQMLKDWSPAELRLYFLGTHYRAQMNLTNDGLTASRAAWERFRQFRNIAKGVLQRGGMAGPSVTDLAKVSPDSPWAKLAQSAKAKFAEAMDDDFNTPRALAAVQEFMGEAYKLGLENAEDAAGKASAMQSFEEMAGVLGLDESSILTSTGLEGDNKPFVELVELLIARRNEARAERNFAAADILRDLLRDAGIVLEDSASGTRWKAE
jgi:cysteinyl-tRNA synthetase